MKRPKAKNVGHGCANKAVHVAVIAALGVTMSGCTNMPFTKDAASRVTTIYDFDYVVEWKHPRDRNTPAGQVFDDGRHTYIQLPSNLVLKEAYRQTVEGLTSVSFESGSPYIMAPGRGGWVFVTNAGTITAHPKKSTRRPGPQLAESGPGPQAHWSFPVGTVHADVSETDELDALNNRIRELSDMIMALEAPVDEGTTATPETVGLRSPIATRASKNPEHESIPFALGRATLGPRGRAVVDRLAARIKTSRVKRIVLRGITTPEGGEPLNRRIGTGRAYAVRARLIDEHRIAPHRIEIAQWDPRYEGTQVAVRLEAQAREEVAWQAAPAAPTNTRRAQKDERIHASWSVPAGTALASKHPARDRQWNTVAARSKKQAQGLNSKVETLRARIRDLEAAITSLEETTGRQVGGVQAPSSSGARETVPFEFGEYTLGDQAAAVIDRIAVKAPQAYRILLRGITTPHGTTEINRQIGMERANAVRARLVYHHRVPPEKIEILQWDPRFNGKRADVRLVFKVRRTADANT